MTKSELTEAMLRKLNLTKVKAESAVNCIFDSMTAALKRGDRVEIRGFGSLTIRSYKGYEGRNPRTGVPVRILPKKLPFFKVGKDLQERVNDGKRAEV